MQRDMTHRPSVDESWELPCINICNSARAATSIACQLYTPQNHVQCYHRIDEPAGPTVYPHEFVEVYICEKRYGENGKGCTLEGKEDNKWEESEGNKACSTPRSPPRLLNCVLRYVGRSIAHRQTPEEFIRGSDVVWPHESDRKGDYYEREERK